MPDDHFPTWNEPGSFPPGGQPPPPPIGPWATPGAGWPPPGDPSWPPPVSPPHGRQPGRAFRPPFRPYRLRGRLAAPVLLLYAVLQGLRLGRATAHDSVAVTVALDAGLFAAVFLIGVWATRRSRRRNQDLYDPTLSHPAPAARRSLLAGWTAGLLAVTLVSSIAARDFASHPRRAGIADAPGYSTYGGPNGYPLAQGRPWGTPCQPLRISVGSVVPTPVYDQIVAAVESARSEGVDVTVESRNLMWVPSQLYPPGQDNQTVRSVEIFASAATAPLLPDGHRTRIEFGWDAQAFLDGHHDHLTDLQATLYLGELQGYPDRVRIAARQLIAFSQGVGGSTVGGSGIARGTTVDGFTPADLHAMEVMSGCDYAAAPPAPPLSFSS